MSLFGHGVSGIVRASRQALFREMEEDGGRPERYQKVLLEACPFLIQDERRRGGRERRAGQPAHSECQRGVCHGERGRSPVFLREIHGPGALLYPSRDKRSAARETGEASFPRGLRTALRRHSSVQGGLVGFSIPPGKRKGLPKGALFR